MAEEAGRRTGVLAGERGTCEVEELAAVVVTECPRRDPLRDGHERSPFHAGPARRVRQGGGTEGREVPAEEVLEALVLGHLPGWKPLGCEPEQVGSPALPRAGGRHAHERNPRSRPDRRAPRREQRVDLAAVPRASGKRGLELLLHELEVGRGLVPAPRPEPPLAARRADARCEGPVVPRGDDVDRRAHERALHRVLALECSCEGVALEPVEHRPEPDVRRRRVLRLEPGDTLECPAERELRPGEQQLAREERPVEPPRRERHGRTAAFR